ncbi:MAG TPA: multicopper oxidase domain-containing protein [Candidatus Angelobacter sp.]|jgi:FtsP/CotA-like multicopper oxidase with cupredoxin domain|nr:multicopper oxidase domain-containing protein [Candidatus Angelobacter sp.]
MGRKNNGQEGLFLSPDADPRRLRDAENARRNRAEITKALSHGKVSRRDLIKWGLFTSAGMMAPIGGLNPFVRPLNAQSGFSFSGGSCSSIPTGLPPSPTFGVQPFTQPMPRFDVLPRNTVSTLTPAPQAQANQTQQPVDPRLVGGQTGLTGPIEGRPPGANWAHQGFAQFPPQVAVEITTKEVTTNTSYNPGVTSDLNSGINPSTPIPPKFHPGFPAQNANRVWTFNGTFPPKLMQVRYGEPVLFRHHNGLTTDITNNGGFGRFTLTTHEHNAHHGAENDGFTGAYFWPNQFYDYHYPWVLAGFRSINTGATDPRAGGPTDSGGINKIPGDWHETMSTHWFHDHMFTFTDQNVYKGNAGMNNLYSSLDRGNESLNDGVNLRLPSGTAKSWGNLDFDVNLMLADKAWDANGQLNMDTLAFDGFLGDQMTVNFAWKPFFNVYARRYRLRILNASVSRFFALALSDSSNMVQIANDGNLLPRTVNLAQTAQLGIAERYDIVIDFSRYTSGQTVDLVNLQQMQDGKQPGPVLTVSQAVSGTSCDPCVGAFLRFKILGPPPQADQSVDVSGNGQGIVLIPNPTLPAVVRQRRFTFDDRAGQTTNDPITTYTGNGNWGIATENTGGSSRHRGGSALKADYGRISSQPAYGTCEEWTLQGGFGWDHPIHIHFEEGQIISRNGSAPSPAESGRKDVYRLGLNGTVVIRMQFRDWGGMYMEHCHNTMHEDNAMLLRWDIGAGGPFLNPLPTPISKPTGVTFQAPDEILPNA